MAANAHLGFFRREELPGGIGCEPCYSTDVTSYRDLYWAAFALRLRCVEGEQRFGWTEMGMPPFSPVVDSAGKTLLVVVVQVLMTIADMLWSVRVKRYKTQHRNLSLGFWVFDGQAGSRGWPTPIADNLWDGKHERIPNLEHCETCT